MLRRDIRLRKEYLYRKSLEGKQKEEYEKKQKIRDALDGDYYESFYQKYAQILDKRSTT